MDKSPPSHRVETIAQLGALVTAENFVNLALDVTNWLFAMSQIKRLDPNADAPYFDWIDDGKNEQHITLESADAAPLTAAGAQPQT